MINPEGTLDDQYLDWLYQLVASSRNRNPARSYRKLIKRLYVTPFIFFIPNDDNRAEDGRDLRLEFLEELSEESIEVDWLEQPCSVLEMLIALARRAAYNGEGLVINWFWKMLENAGLNEYTDANFDLRSEREVDITLSHILERKYQRNGVGGFFPLHNPRGDQRKVELWYQLSAYLNEGGHV